MTYDRTLPRSKNKRICTVPVRARNIGHAIKHKAIMKVIRGDLLTRFGNVDNAAHELGVCKFTLYKIIQGRILIPGYIQAEYKIVQGRFVYDIKTGALVSEAEAFARIRERVRVDFNGSFRQFEKRYRLKNSYVSATLNKRLCLSDKILKPVGLKTGVFIFNRGKL